MKTWLRDTNDPNQSLDDDLKDILSRPATWKNPSKTISRSPSTTQIEEVDADETKTDNKKQLDAISTNQKNNIEEYNSILETNYMRDIDRNLIKKDLNYPVLSIRKQHVPIIWNTIVKTYLKHTTFDDFEAPPF